MSLPQRDEDWLDNLTKDFCANPLHERDDDVDFYTPDNTAVKMHTVNPLQGHVDDLYAENAELDARCKQLAAERDEALRDKEDLTEECARVVKLSRDLDDQRLAAIADAGKITTLLNHEKTQTANLMTERRTMEQRLYTWRCVALVGSVPALAGWALWLVALVRR